MPQTCPNCSRAFEIMKNDLEFYDRISPAIAGKKYSVPPPTLCPDCRLQRRLAHRNEKNLYHRKCDKTGKQIISIYAPNTEIVVYAKDEWWGDGWDPKSYGREFDFSRPFFEQLSSLQKLVPRMSFQQERNENSDYTSNVSHLKNCYLLFSSDFSRDCAYGIWIQRSRDCMDNLIIDECDWSYECFFSVKLYRCKYVYSSSQCSDSAFLFDCRNCKNCLMCWGFRNKEYCIANKQYSKQEYEKRMKEFPLSSHANLTVVKKQFAELLRSAPKPAMRKQGTVIDSTGDLLIQCQNCRNCYELRGAKDCRNTIGFQAVDAVDCTYVMGEFGYEQCECFPMPQHSAFTMNSYSGSDLYYCDMCMLQSEQCFGCVGLKRGKYCILNKQYMKDEYELLVPKIIEHMRKTGEWGEFFPIAMSMFGYNASEAQQYFPVSKEEVGRRKWQWFEEEKSEDRHLEPEVDIPDSIDDVPDDIVQRILHCETTGKSFKIIPQELRFYRQMGIPIPHVCPDERHAERIELRNSRTLWKRNCTACKKSIETTYAPDRPDIIYCEECYLKTIY